LLHGNGERVGGGGSFSKLRQHVTQEQRNTGEQPDIPAPETSIVADTRGYTIAGLVLAGLLLLTFALTSDASQLAQPHVSAIVLDWLYLAARSVWLGSLTYLGYVLLPLLPTIEQDRQASLLTSILRRFHPLLLGTVGVLLVSGLYLSESSIFDPHQLIGDPFGRSLLVTLVLVGLMMLLSAYIIFVLRPKLARQAALLPVIDAELPTRRTRQSALEQTVRGIKRATSVLSWLGAGVLLCAALMAFFGPPIVFPTIDYATAANTRSAPPAGINAQTEQVGNLSVTLQVSPGRSGYANTVILTINDSNGNPVTDAQVQLTTNMVIMDMGSAHVSVAGGNPTYIATFSKEQAFSMSGLWDITVKIQLPHQSPVQTIFQVTLNP
jgi:putative copper export protein